jgi:hypothetical protein
MVYWVERLFPYWSIGINLLLGLTMLPQSHDIAYGRKFASILTALPTLFQ